MCPVVLTVWKYANCLLTSHYNAVDISGRSTGEMDDQSIKIEDPKMQTSELPKKIRFNGLRLLGANTIHHALRRGAKNLGFYKKKLQHALTSRKRTEKEYKQLAIWYGDIEVDLDELTDLSLLLSVATIPVSNDSAVENTQGSEWEHV
ncbi:hypothetical protein Droror1_Dr00014141 [Drosera rotundifolia]